MNISDIPYPKVKALAEKYRAQGDWACDSASDCVFYAFCWDETEEGDDFWCRVYRGEWNKAQGICPHLFDPPPVVAYSYEIAKFYHATTGEYTGWAQQVSFERPPMGPGFRNLVELVAR